MPTYRTTLTTATPAEVVFDYLARFSSAAEWDPSVVAARNLTPLSERRVGVGSAFELTVRVAGRDVPFRYVIISLDRPRSVRLRAETGSFISTDTIEIAGVGGTTEVTYDAVLEPKGVAGLLRPILAFAFRRLGDRAAQGLQREIDHLADTPRLGADEGAPSWDGEAT